MKLKYIRYLLSVLLVVFLIQCEGTVNTQPEEPDSNSTDSTLVQDHSSGVMMQGFYWNVPKGGNWWNTIKSKADELANMSSGYGIERIWLPPPSKAMSGASSMGYDPADYYDLGNYYQYGTTETRFGSKAELKSVIKTLHSYNISVIGDIVLNHRSGGDTEFNPAEGTNTWTDFSNVKSGKMTWHWKTFHPNLKHASDPGHFGGMPDICYKTGQAAKDMKAWLNWLQEDIGFNGGWRFDYAKGLKPRVIKEMMAATGNPFSIGEYWTGNTSTLNWWVNQTGASVFDFALYYTMRDIFNQTDGGGHLPNLIDPSKSFAAKRPMKAVTFVGNHDTDEINHDKMLAYAFILTYQGYPSIWWKDYFNNGLSDLGGKWGNGINPLVWVRGQLASGAPTIELLKTDSGDLLIYGAKGISSASPGYIVLVNDHPTDWKGAQVHTTNTYLHGKTLKAYAWWSSVSSQNISPENELVDGAGRVELWAPPRGYAVYSVKGF